MSDCKWTPGPWRQSTGVGYCAIRVDGGVIADMRFVDQAYNPFDANLIAAAPLMHLSLANRSLLCDDDFEDIVAAIEEGDSEKLRDLWERVQAKARKV